jgi:hypothetical protein
MEEHTLAVQWKKCQPIPNKQLKHLSKSTSESLRKRPCTIKLVTPATPKRHLRILMHSIVC